MALKIYELNGLTFQFDDQDVPAGAVEVKPADVIVGEIVTDVPELDPVAVVPEVPEPVAEPVAEAEAEVKADVPENKAVEPDNKAVADGKPATRAKR